MNKTEWCTLDTKEKDHHEFPLDIAMEIQEALKPLTYRVTAFADEGGEYTVKLKKIGVYSDSSTG